MLWWTLLRLRIGDSKGRRDAARKLGSIRNPRAVTALIEALRDDDRSLRAAAASALGKIGGRSAVEPLIVALEDDSIDVRSAVAKSLGELGRTKAVQPLLNALQDDHSQVRDAAVEGLAAIGDAAADFLVTALEHKKSEVRRSAAWALGKIGDTRAVASLVGALEDRDSEVSRAAAGALSALEWKPADATQQTLYLIARRQWDEVARIGPAAVHSLASALRSEDVDVRLAAVRTLEKCENGSAAKALVFALRDREALVRKAASDALASRGWTPVSDTDRALYSAAKGQWVEAFRLGRGAVEALAVAFFDGHTDVRRAAVKSLERLRDTEGLAVVLWALKDDRGDVRRKAVEVLGDIGDEKVVQSLVSVLGDPMGDVRVAAVEALAKIGDAAVEALIGSLNNNVPEIQELSATALGEIGDVRGVRPLAMTLQKGPNGARRAAAEALGCMGDPNAVGPLLRALNDEHTAVRQAAAEALGEIGNVSSSATATIMKHTADESIAQSVVDTLTAVLDGDSKHVRDADLRTLAQLRDVRQVLYDSTGGPDGPPQVIGKYEVPVSKLRDLARQELIRRNPEVKRLLPPVSRGESLSIECKCGHKYSVKSEQFGSPPKCPRCDFHIAIPCLYRL